MIVKVVTNSTPLFEHSVYEQTIPENIPVSSAVTTVLAQSPGGHKIIYTISDGDDHNEFTVHFSTGTHAFASVVKPVTQ